MSPNLGVGTVEVAKATFVTAFWGVLVNYVSRLPPDSTFSLLALPVPTVPFLNVITSFLGASLVYSVLYVFTGRTNFRNMGLFWLFVLPAFFVWFWLVLAIVVTAPLLDLVAIPLFFSGLALLLGYWENYVSRGRFFDRLRKVSTKVFGWVLGKVRGPRILLDTNYGL